MYEKRVSFPPLDEQEAIAAYLDRKTQEIDTLIEKKQALIALLREQRTALINRAVTKGLNPAAPMKDSGVEWLGEVPEHWEVKRMRYVCSVRQGLQIARSDRLYEDAEGCFKYITIKSINNPNDPPEYIFNPRPNVICNEDDILIARTGATGEVITNQRGAFHNNFFLVDYDRSAVLRDFMVYYLSNVVVKAYLLMCAGTTTIPDLNHGDFLSTPFLHPSLAEQQRVIDFLDRKTGEMDCIIAKGENVIELLQELRTSLISEVVTGKIDVRQRGDDDEDPLGFENPTGLVQNPTGLV